MFKNTRLKFLFFAILISNGTIRAVNYFQGEDLSWWGFTLMILSFVVAFSFLVDFYKQKRKQKDT